MNHYFFEENPIRSFGSFSRTVGMALIAVGVAGLVLPELVSLGTVVLFSGLLIGAGLLWAVHSYRYEPRRLTTWLKPVLLFSVGGLLLFSPEVGVAALGLLIAFYLLMDAISSFILAQLIHPVRGWGWMALNGVVSAVLALLFLSGWPDSSAWWVGLYISISLMFDGWALLTLGWVLRK